MIKLVGPTFDQIESKGIAIEGCCIDVAATGKIAKRDAGVGRFGNLVFRNSNEMLPVDSCKNVISGKEECAGVQSGDNFPTELSIFTKQTQTGSFELRLHEVTNGRVSKVNST